MDHLEHQDILADLLGLLLFTVDDIERVPHNLRRSLARKAPVTILEAQGPRAALSLNAWVIP